MGELLAVPGALVICHLVFHNHSNLGSFSKTDSISNCSYFALQTEALYDKCMTQGTQLLVLHKLVTIMSIGVLTLLVDTGQPQPPLE
jgi:hypothetical protein